MVSVRGRSNPQYCKTLLLVVSDLLRLLSKVQMQRIRESCTGSYNDFSSNPIIDYRTVFGTNSTPSLSFIFMSFSDLFSSPDSPKAAIISEKGMVF